MPHDIRSELSALQDDLKSGAATVRPAASERAEAPKHDKWPELSRVLQDLQTQLQETAGEAEDLLAEHPIAAVASAFLLGVVVGRTMGYIK
jgi:ElaB/YqjD/DUF883 family membrane-anchored ribosome-binding protein